MEAKDLVFSYGKGIVIDGLNIKIRSGAITTVLGANGSGKSTLFNLMTKNLVPQKGSITLEGQNIREIPLKAFAQKVSIVHQQNTAPEDIQVKKLVAYGRLPFQRPFCGASQKDQEHIRWALAVTGLEKEKDKNIHQLSGGQKQRVWIAMSLAQNPRLMFLDEPTTYLDIRYQIEILQLIASLNRDHKMSIVMVLHDINQALFYSDDIIGLKNGKVVFQGEASRVVTEEALEEIYGVHLSLEQRKEKKFVLAV